jgi:hypothetical protein
MRLHLKTALIVGVLSLAAMPALAVAAGHKPATVPPTEAGVSGQVTGPNYNPSPPSPPSQAKAYGVLCRGESKKHVEDQKRTPFAECVLAMARAAHHGGLSPRQACQGLSKKHVKGQKQTPFAACVVAAAKLRHEEEQKEGS